jgi:hypothetical protein
MRTRLFHAMFVVLALSSSAVAQTTLDPSLQQLTAPNPETYGTASEVAIAVPESEFNPYTSTTTFSWSGGGRYSTAAGELDAGVHFPAGASITRMEVQACNSNTVNGGGLGMFEKNNSGTITLLALALVSANSGCTLFPVTLSPPHTVDNAINSYFLVWGNSPALDGSIKLQAARVYYKLQISPDPSTATFTDVPVGHPFHRFVEALPRLESPVAVAAATTAPMRRSPAGK